MCEGRNLKAWLFTSIFLLVMAGLAQARTITVGPGPGYDFNSIQPAIDDSNDGDTIIVQPGVYLEYVRFRGKNITLTSTNPYDFNIVTSTSISSIGFLGTEDPNCTLSGFKINAIYGAEYDIDPRGKNHNNATISHCLFSCNVTYNATVISGCDGTISNCVVVDNKPGGHLIAPAIIGCHGLVKNCTVVNNFVTGIMVLRGGTTTIENCIIYGNIVRLDNGATLNILYSDVEGGLDGIYREGYRTVNWGPGNIDADPCFVRLGDLFGTFEGDYHLKSQAGRWEPSSQRWVKDANTSPCIDAGNPHSPIGLEPFPNGGRINMGAYGGTPEASKSYFGEPLCETIVPGDINGDCKVNFFDFQLLALHWLGGKRYIPPIPNIPPFVDIKKPQNEEVFYEDVTVEIGIEADASDDDGVVVKVEFFANGNKIGEDNDGTDGWKTIWQDITPGIYNLTAKATDNDEAETTSPPIEITIKSGGPPPPP